MEVLIKKDNCIYCGCCEMICSDIFYLKENGEVYINKSEVKDERKSLIEKAIFECPTKAIYFKNKYEKAIKQDIATKDNRSKIRIFVDNDMCPCCGLCRDICPDIFHIDTQREIVCIKKSRIEKKLKDSVNRAISECPMYAIKYIVTQHSND